MGLSKQLMVRVGLSVDNKGWSETGFPYGGCYNGEKSSSSLILIKNYGTNRKNRTFVYRVSDDCNKPLYDTRILLINSFGRTRWFKVLSRSRYQVIPH